MNASSRLFNKNFVLLWQGQLISQLGSQAYFIALMFWLKHATGSASLMGLIMMTANIPAVLLGPIAGTFADHHSRKMIIVICDMVNGIVVLLLAAMVFFMPDQNDVIIVWLFIVALITSVISTFFQPAITASIPDIVPEEKLAAGNSMNQFSVQLSTFIGQGMGGVLYRVLGAPVLFLIDGLSFIFSSISEMFIKIPQKIDRTKLNKKELFKRYLNDTKIGFKYIWTNPGMKSLYVAAAFLNFFLIPIIVLLPFYVEDTLSLTTDWYGYMMASFGLGAMIGYLVAGTLKISGKSRSKLMIFCLLIMSALMGILGILNSGISAVILFWFVGVTNGFLNINILTILQLSTPSELRGRVFGVRTTISSSLAPISMGLSGIVSEMLNNDIPLIFVSCGLITVLLTLAVASGKPFREFLAYEKKNCSE